MTILPPSLPPELAAEIADALRACHGVVRREELYDLGLSNAHVDRMLEARRWQSDAAGLIVITHNGPLTVEQKEAVAVAAGGRLCGLAARTAAAHAGLVGWSSDLVEVVVPRGCSYPKLELVVVKVHESRRFTPDDLHPTARPRRVRIERALIDGAAWSRAPRTACGLVAAGVQQRLTTADRLLAQLDNVGQVRHARLLRSALVDIDGGAHAMTEIDFVRFCARNRLPRPIHQQVRKDFKGRRRYLDATLVGPTGVVVRVEIDGALHLVVRTYWDDMRRGNDLVIGRETVLRFPSFVIYADEPEAVDQLRRALELSGPGAQDAA